MPYALISHSIKEVRPLLNYLEQQRLKDAYGSVFYRRLMLARRELVQALEEIDEAILIYDQMPKEGEVNAGTESSE